MSRFVKFKNFMKESASTDDFEVTMNHILYELSDNNFEVDFNLWKVEGNELSFEITIGKSNIVPDGWGGQGSKVREEFNWSNIEEVMIRVCDYLSIVSSKVTFIYEDIDGEHHYNFNNYNDLLVKMEQDFPDYYDKYEGWFIFGFVIELKN